MSLKGTTLVFHFCLTIILAIVCGITFPQTGISSNYIPLMIGVMLFFNFLDVKIYFRELQLKVLFLTFFLSAFAMPVFVYYLLSLGFEQSYRIGLLLIACAPTGISTLVIGQYIKGTNYNLVLNHFIFITFCSMFYIPIILKLMLNETVEFEILPFNIIGQMSALVVFPYFASRTIVYFFKLRGLLWLKKMSKGVTLVLLFGVIMVSIGKINDRVVWSTESLWLSLSILAIFLIHGGLGYGFGCLWKSTELKNTLPIICSSRNIQLVFAIAVLNFSPLTYVPIILGIFFHHLTNAFWLWMSGKSRSHEGFN